MSCDDNCKPAGRKSQFGSGLELVDDMIVFLL